jgi:ABC-type nitrate/sulfonate/bicarbonate transport system permease component
MMNKKSLQMLISALCLLAIWEIVGRTQLLETAFPPLTTVLETLASPARRSLLTGAVLATTGSAVGGLVIGAGLGCGIAATRQAIKALRPGLDRLSATINAVPHVAIAPVMIILFGRGGAPMAVAAIAAFFPAYAAATRAFAASSSAHQDLFTVLGSTRVSRLSRLELPAALPGLADALRLAAPGAVLGAVLGEWFGAPRGIGLVIITASQNYDIPLLWAAAVLSTAMAMIGYLIFTVLQSAAARRFA